MNEDLRRETVRAALATRTRLGIERTSPVCPFDAAERLGVEVKFRNETSMEGMYCRTTRPTILVSAHRPAGRRAYTCGHELGHHVLGHGTRIDELVDNASKRATRDPAEDAADLFSAMFLMPKPVVSRMFDGDAVTVEEATSLHVYRIAARLGVGYETVLTHLRWSLRLLAEDRYRELARRHVKDIKADLVGYDTSAAVWPVDGAWYGRPVDVEVGDILVVPPGVAHEGRVLEPAGTGPHGALLVATRPGLARLADGSWSTFVRVQRLRFVGRAIFRHLEDPDADAE